MVKLIKVNSPYQLINNEARFTAFFQEDIEVNENSRIALKNIQLSPDAVVIIGEGTGIDVSLKRSANGSPNFVRVPIKAGEYVLTDLQQLIYIALNSGFLQTDCAVSGRAPLLNRVAFQVSTVSGKFEINLKFTADVFNSGLSANPNIAYDATTQRYTKTANNGNFDYISGLTPMCNGTGTVAFNVLNNAGSLDGCLLGITSLYGAGPLNPRFTVFTEAGFYVYQDESNAPVATIIPVQNNDRVELKIEKGQARLQITRNNGTVVPTTIAKTLDYNVNTGVYFGLKSIQSCMREITWTPDPFFANNDGVITHSSKDYIYSSNLTDASPQTADITFLNGLQRILGYEQISYNQTGVSMTFLAEKALISAKIPDGFYIVLDNVKLDSYDYNPGNGVGRRKNVLANITEFTLATTHNLITYETDDPIYIDVSNKNKYILNSLQFSIYDQENNLISVDTPLNVSTNKQSSIKLTLLILD